MIGPISAEPCRAKTSPLPRASILFRPHKPPNAGGEMVEAPGTAPGSATPIPRSVYRHSRLPDEGNIRLPGLRKKPLSFSSRHGRPGTTAVHAFLPEGFNA